MSSSYRRRCAELAAERAVNRALRHDALAMAVAIGEAYDLRTWAPSSPTWAKATDAARRIQGVKRQSYAKLMPVA
jgi:hypothetical protein